MTPRFAEAIRLLPFEQLTSTVNRYHQFAKTVRPQDLNDSRQKHISMEVLEPFLNCLKNSHKDNPIPKIDYEIETKNILILTRSAVKNGMYAPGKQIFSVTKSLLAEGKNVHLISLGEVDQSFIRLMKENSTFNILSQKGSDLNDKHHFYALREKINQFRPAAIFTEIEVSILVAIQLCKLPSPIF